MPALLAREFNPVFENVWHLLTAGVGVLWGRVGRQIGIKPLDCIHMH